MPNLCSSNDKKTWYTLSIIYSINPRGCPPLATISLVQALCMLGDSGFFRLQGIKVLWRLQFLGYLRTLSLKFQKVRTKIEVVLSLPCWLSQYSGQLQFWSEPSERSIFQTFWRAYSCTIFLFFWVRDIKFWLLSYFFISFNCAKFQQDWTTLILVIL
jgi:hypothetical protein